MNESKRVAIDAETLGERVGSGYPDPYDKPCADRRKKPLGDAFGLADYGVNLVSLPPGTWSSQRHWHSLEDEFIYILEGRPILVTNEGETHLEPGMCAGFPAGIANGHHLVNNTDDVVAYLEVGSRQDEDDVDYSDIDMQVKKRGYGTGFSHKDGSPYT